MVSPNSEDLDLAEFFVIFLNKHFRTKMKLCNKSNLNAFSGFGETSLKLNKKK